MRATLLLLALVAAPASARGECRPPAATSRMRLSLQPNASLPEAAAWIAAITCKNVVYSSTVAARAGRVSIIAPNELTPAQAYEVFVDAMTALGLAVQRTKQSLIVKPAPAFWRTPETVAAAPAELDLASHIRKKKEAEYEITRALLDQLLGDPTLLRRSAQTIFHSEGGTTGLKLVTVREGMLWARLGLKSGDVICKANGLALTGPEQALMAFVSLRGRNEVTLEVRRQGKLLTLRYSVH